MKTILIALSIICLASVMEAQPAQLNPSYNVVTLNVIKLKDDTLEVYNPTNGKYLKIQLKQTVGAAPLILSTRFSGDTTLASGQSIVIPVYGVTSNWVATVNWEYGYEGEGVLSAVCGTNQITVHTNAVESANRKFYWTAQPKVR